MKRLQNSKTVLALLTILIMPAPLSAQDFDEVEILTHHVKDNIYYLEGSGGNIGVIIGDDGVLIIDNQFAPLTNKIEAAITDLTKLPVTFVVNSHFHYDHTCGLPFFEPAYKKGFEFTISSANLQTRKETRDVLKEQISSPSFPITIDNFSASIEYKNFEIKKDFFLSNDIKVKTTNFTGWVKIENSWGLN